MRLQLERILQRSMQRRLQLERYTAEKYAEEIAAEKYAEEIAAEKYKEEIAKKTARKDAN